MKRLTIIAAVVVASLVVSWDAVEFAGGYSGFPVVPPFLFVPASFLLFALMFLASCASATIVLVALFRRQLRLAATLIVVLCASWLLSPWFVARPAFLLGFATRLRTMTTPAEIQSAAQICLAAFPGGGRIVGPEKGLGLPPEEEESGNRAWEALSRFGFVHLLDDTCVVFVEPPEVAFSWGGALPGHWGIHVLGATDARVPSHYLQTWRFSDRIVLFRGH